MKVSGVVKDTFGELSGATIILLRSGKQTNLATITNDKGYFEIENPKIKSNDDFEIRHLGLETKVLKAKELKDAEITLKDDIEELDEVVLTATVGEKPKSKPKVVLLPNQSNQEPWYLTPTFIFTTLSLITLGTIILVIRKSKK